MRKILLFIFTLIAGCSLFADPSTNAPSVILPNGNIMVCGGVNQQNQPVSSCTIFLSTPTFTDVGGKIADSSTLQTSRTEHTMTLLPDGRVLIAGGYTSVNFHVPPYIHYPSKLISTGTPTASMEVCLSTPPYTCSLIGNMQTPRAGHSAVLLSRGPYQGNVLICGGQNQSSPATITNSCEIFITTQNTTIPAPSMTSRRFHHSTSLLPNGKVLFSGGITDIYTSTFNFTPTQELYDPQTNSFTASVQPLFTGRAYHSSVVTNNGNVLIIGGYNEYNTKDLLSKDPEDLAAPDQQAQGSWGFSNLMEMFDKNASRVPIENQQYKILPVNISNAFSLLQPDGRVVVMGGRGNIPVTYITPSVKFDDGSILYLNWPESVSNSTATRTTLISINSSDTLKFSQKITLSREVTGMIINGDLFLGKPNKPDPENRLRLSVANLKWYALGTSTSVLDSIMVGDSQNRGVIDTQLSLYYPDRIFGSYIQFDPVSLQGGNSTASGRICLDNACTPQTLSLGQSAPIATSSTMSLTLISQIPSIYENAIIRGTTTLTAASIQDLNFTLTITNGYGEVLNQTVGSSGTISWPISFTSLSGTIFCSTDTCRFPLNFSGDVASSIQANLSFTSDRVDLSGTNYDTGGSTVVIRDMIFSDISYYEPATSNWNLDKTYIITAKPNASPLPFPPYPIFNHNAVITNSDIPMTIWGTTCYNRDENSKDCTRDNPLFSTTTLTYLLKQDASNEWIDYGKMNQNRANHTSTVLTDGSVLVCGGTNGIMTLSSCETYIPTIKQWIIISTMTTPRSYHRATLLVNGNVLITGGVQGDINQSQALDLAEIYYPSTKSFVKVANMNAKRAAHTQTLLPDGNILITGGISAGQYSNTAEVFITTANIFVPVSNMTVSRARHTATLMKNGMVLICGGINANSVLSSCEIYNPQTGSFTSTNPFSTPRHSHTSTLLEDGRILIIGGNNGLTTVDEAEVFDINTSSWQALGHIEDNGKPNKAKIVNRSNHLSTLLPNKNIMITGGEEIEPGGLVQKDALTLFTDLYFIGNSQKVISSTGKRMNHSAVLLPSNRVLVTGGWDGSNYINTTYAHYYLNDEPDAYGLQTITPRKPFISSATIRIDRGDTLVVISTYSNFHSISPASNNSTGGRNSDISKPHILLRGIDNEFMVDLSSQIYIKSNNISWETTLSTINVILPSDLNIPYGWYYLYVCNSGICSDGYIIQISTPRPDCSIINLQADQSISTTSLRWHWQLQSFNNANGFGVFSISNVFITTVSFPNPLSSPATYYQDGLLPNTPSAIKVGCYNIGGFSDPSTYAVSQSTIYTLANPPKDLRVTYASFDTVDLEWDSSNNNPDYTPYQVEVSTYPDFSEYGIIMSFYNNYKSTKLTIRNLEPNYRYYFRVKARNGNGIETVYDIQNPQSSTFNNPASTITVGNIVGLDGIPLSPTSIKWTWNKAGGATGYEVYEYRVSTDFYTKEVKDVSIFLASTTYNYFTQINLSTNTAYRVKVRSYKQDSQTYNQLVYGPFSISDFIYTLAAVPANSNNVFTDVKTDGFKVTWDANGNTIDTTYRLDISDTQDFTNFSSYNVTTDSTTFPFIYTYVSNLKPNYKYHARVYAINKAGKITDSSQYLGYKYTLARPVGKVYASSISLTGVLLNWDPQDNSPQTIYQVRATSVSFESPFISTPVPFGLSFNGTSYLINGLWINTTYYFDVTARNMEGIESASIQTTTPALTLPGPNGAPPSSIAGIANPDSDTIISGNLIDNRYAQIKIYKNTFLTSQPIAVAKLNSNPCGYTFGGSTITFGIYAYEQPYIPIEFTFNYFNYEAINPSLPPDINTNKSRIALARYNPDTGQCLPVKTEIDTGLRKITAQLNHFSIYQLIILNPTSDLNNVKIFPNPFYPNRAGQGMITITNLPTDANIKIYTLSGQKVYEASSDPTGTVYWNGKNLKGQMVGSGVYLCNIKSQGKTKTIKIAVER